MMFVARRRLDHLCDESLREAQEQMENGSPIQFLLVSRIRIVDRKCLKRRVCECYPVVRKEYGRVLDDIDPSR